MQRAFMVSLTNVVLYTSREIFLRDGNMAAKEEKIDVERIYKFWQETLGMVPEPVRLLGAQAPEMLDAYNRMREYYLREPPKGALPRKVKELLYVALDIALGAPAKAMQGHVRAAVKAGATTAEVVEAVALTIMLAGMPKYMSLGYEAIKAAVDSGGE